MRCLLAMTIALTIALQPAPVTASSAWGSPGYGDPPSWCTKFSDMWTAKIVTNDPLVGMNPERDTFYGFHPNPGYDDWYGYFYGDFRGSAGDASGWVSLLHEDFPNHYHWNFADNGWAVHGHAKQYVAYYNWTFGGECGLGRYGSGLPPPYMADQYGYPVVDIYVDSVPPQSPRPQVLRVSTNSVAFKWDPVVDVGDGAGADYFVAGMDHYTSWVTMNGGSQSLQLLETVEPRIVTQSRMSPLDVACVHVQAFDKVQNASPEQVVCSRALTTPPMPRWNELTARVDANPAGGGLVGLDSWFWLDPAPPASRSRPAGHALDRDCHHRPRRARRLIGRVPLSQERDPLFEHGTVDHDARASVGAHPPELGPVVFVVIDQHGNVWIGLDVAE